MDTTNHSEVAHIREQITLESQAAHNGLCGLAIVASHRSITERMEQGAARLLKLIEQGKHDEVARLMETPDWGVGREPGDMSHYDGMR